MILNEKIRLRIFQALAFSVAFYHIIYGALGIFAPFKRIISASPIIFGLSFEMSNQSLVLIKIISSYMLIFGVLMLFIALRPVKYKDLTLIAVLFFIINTIYRIIYSSIFLENFNSTYSRSLLCIFFMLFFAIGLVLTFPKILLKKLKKDL